MCGFDFSREKNIEEKPFDYSDIQAGVRSECVWMQEIDDLLEGNSI